MLDFLARLHPLLVHLPLGILLFGTVATIFFEKKSALRAALPLVWAFGAGSAVLACASGWLLASAAGADESLPTHQWLGITTAALASTVWIFRKKILENTALRSAYAATTLAFLALTMHNGSRLTHGDDYLFKKTETAAASLEESGVLPATDLPTEPVKAANTADFQALAQTGALVMPLAAGSNYLSVNCLNAPAFADADAVFLEKLAPQIVWLRLSGTAISDSALLHVGRLTQLTRLQLDHTRITDAGLPFLKNLKNLRHLNLAADSITATGLSSLRDLPNLLKINLFKTKIAADEVGALRQFFPKTELDTGGYFVPTLPADTALLKAAKK